MLVNKDSTPWLLPLPCMILEVMFTDINNVRRLIKVVIFETFLNAAIAIVVCEFELYRVMILNANSCAN